MSYIIVIQTASQEYSYWPEERLKDLPGGYEPEPSGKTVKTIEEAVAWIQIKYKAEEEKRSKQEDQNQQDN